MKRHIDDNCNIVIEIFDSEDPQGFIESNLDLMLMNNKDLYARDTFTKSVAYTIDKDLYETTEFQKHLISFILRHGAFE